LSCFLAAAPVAPAAPVDPLLLQLQAKVDRLEQLQAGDEHQEKIEQLKKLQEKNGAQIDKIQDYLEPIYEDLKELVPEGREVVRDGREVIADLEQKVPAASAAADSCTKGVEAIREGLVQSQTAADYLKELHVSAFKAGETYFKMKTALDKPAEVKSYIWIRLRGTRIRPGLSLDFHFLSKKRIR
jgi:hypothetical protein